MATLAGVDGLLDDLNAALAVIQRDAVKAVQANAQPARQDIAVAWQAETFFNLTGARDNIRPYGARWSRIKRKFGYSLQKGTATGAVQKVLNRKTAVKLLPNGFLIDFAAASVGVNARYRNRRVGARRRKGAKPFKRPPTRQVPVASYIGFMARAKAPGLGTLSKVRQGKIKRDIQTAIDKRILNVSKSIRRAAGQKGGYVLQATFDLFISGRRA